MSSEDEAQTGESEQWEIGTIYGAHTRKGLVQVRVGDRRPVLMEPTQARELAQLLHEAAASALEDEYLMAFLMGPMTMSLEAAAQVLDALRQARENQP